MAAARMGRWFGNDPRLAQETVEASVLFRRREIASCFLHGIRGGDEFDSFQIPKAVEAGLRTVCGGKEDVGVEEDDVHVLVAIRRLSVRYRFGIQSHLSDFLDCRDVVFLVDGRGQQEFRPTLRRVGLHRDGDGRTQQNAIVPRLGDDQRAGPKAILPAEWCRDDDCSAAPDLGGFLV
jgi:hypothetical protein